MNFSELLATYVGRRIEVYESDRFVEGVLLRVGTGFFVIRVSVAPYYPGTSDEMTIFNQNVEYVRLLAA